jgi:hypothetical protein
MASFVPPAHLVSETETKFVTTRDPSLIPVLQQELADAEALLATMVKKDNVLEYASVENQIRRLRVLTETRQQTMARVIIPRGRV